MAKAATAKIQRRRATDPKVVKENLDYVYKYLKRWEGKVPALRTPGSNQRQLKLVT